MKVLRLALAALLMSQMAFADGTSSLPEKPTPQESASWSYRILGFIFRGLENSLKETGLDFEVCSYTSFNPEETISANGMGECLFENFKDGLSKKGATGVTYIWVKTTRGETLPVRVDWRPSEEGLGKMVRELLTLKFEKISQLWAEYIDRDTEAQKPLGYSQNVLGHLRLTFPNGTKLADFLSTESENVLVQQVTKAQQIDFELTPLYKQNGYANYKGVISIQREVETPDQNGQWTLNFKTNMNFLKTSRPFKIKGRLDNDALPLGMP